MNDDKVWIGQVQTPLGTFGAVVTKAGLARLAFPDDPEERGIAWVKRRFPTATVARDQAAMGPLTDELNAYLHGRLRRFTLQVDMRGTPFQVQVWQALTAIPFGETRSYADVASAIGRPKAVRAVGAANGANPVPIIVPCHRVIGRDQTLTGYGGGLDLKRRLLQVEGVGIDR